MKPEMIKVEMPQGDLRHVTRYTRITLNNQPVTAVWRIEGKDLVLGYSDGRFTIVPEFPEEYEPEMLYIVFPPDSKFFGHRTRVYLNGVDLRIRDLKLQIDKDGGSCQITVIGSDVEIIELKSN